MKPRKARHYGSWSTTTHYDAAAKLWRVHVLELDKQFSGTTARDAHHKAAAAIDADARRPYQTPPAAACSHYEGPRPEHDRQLQHAIAKANNAFMGGS